MNSLLIVDFIAKDWSPETQNTVHDFFGKFANAFDAAGRKWKGEFAKTYTRASRTGFAGRYEVRSDCLEEAVAYLHSVGAVTLL